MPSSASEHPSESSEPAAVTARVEGTTHPPVSLPRTEVRVIDALEGPPYQVFVARPVEAPPPEGFPVIYLLDANAIFGTVVETIRLRCRRPDVTGVVPAVVVGIGYPTEQPYDRVRRTHDYTPGPSVESGPGEGRLEGETGGAAGFLKWIECRLKPEIESLLPIDRSRQTLLGHSLGGYFALHVLHTAPASFQRYVAASPSVWWDEARLREGVPALGTWLAEAPRDLRVLVTVGEYEQSLAPSEAGGPRAEQTALRRSSRRMIDGAREVADRIAALSAAGGARVEFEVFAGADHASAVLCTIDRCLRFVLAP